MREDFYSCNGFAFPVEVDISFEVGPFLVIINDVAIRKVSKISTNFNNDSYGLNCYYGKDIIAFIIAHAGQKYMMDVSKCPAVNLYHLTITVK
jgi:hypothetical protein